MKSFLEEFKVFAMRGNVIDLAVAVVIGAAFGKIVASFVDNIITPLIGFMLGGIDFSGLSFTIEGATFTYGIFLQNIIDFIIVAFVIFLVVKAMSNLKKKEPAKTPEVTKPNEEVILLREIRDSLKR